MKKRRLLWAVPPLALILLMVWFVLQPGRESRTVEQFEAHREVLEELARFVIEQGSAQGIVAPSPWYAVDLHDGECPSVEFSFRASGLGSETAYWGVSYVPCDHTMYMKHFYDMGWETLEKKGEVTIFFEPEGDNTCYVRKLDERWYYYEMSF